MSGPEPKKRRISKSENLVKNVKYFSMVSLPNITSDNTASFLTSKKNQTNITSESNATNTTAAAILYNSMITAARLSSNINPTTNKTVAVSPSLIDLSSLMGLSSAPMFYSPPPVPIFTSTTSNHIPLNVETTLPSSLPGCGNDLLMTAAVKKNESKLNFIHQSISPTLSTTSNFWGNSHTKYIDNKESDLKKVPFNQTQKLNQFLPRNVCPPTTCQNLYPPTSVLTSAPPLSEVSQNGNFIDLKNFCIIN